MTLPIFAFILTARLENAHLRHTDAPAKNDSTNEADQNNETKRCALFPTIRPGVSYKYK